MNWMYISGLQFYSYLIHTHTVGMRWRGGGGEANLLGDPLIAWMTVYGR